MSVEKAAKPLATPTDRRRKRRRLKSICQFTPWEKAGFEAGEKVEFDNPEFMEVIGRVCFSSGDPMEKEPSECLVMKFEILENGDVRGHNPQSMRMGYTVSNYASNWIAHLKKEFVTQRCKPLATE